MAQALSKTTYQKLLFDIAGIYDAALKEAGAAAGANFKIRLAGEKSQHERRA